MTHAQFRFAAIGKSFGQRRVLEDVGIELNAGHCVLLSGRNGSGKSTLLRILAGMQKPDRGEVDFGGGPLPWRRCNRYLQQHILYLHQQPYMFDGDVRYNLGYALRRGKDKKSLVAAALHWGGLEGMAHSPARSLSGGERQRLALARAWLRRPAAMLLDEPTANMDAEARVTTLALLRTLKDEGYALVISSHDPHHFDDLFDVHLHLSDGRIGLAEPATQRITVVRR